MKHILILRAASLVALLASSLPLLAEHSVLTGFIGGHEPTDFYPEDRNCGAAELPFVVVNDLRVDASGAYVMLHANSLPGLRAWTRLYDGGFDPARPEAGRVVWADDGSHQLEAGRDYQLVVSAECSLGNGFWTLVFHGPGAVSAPNHTASFDSFNAGVISVPDPPLDWNNETLACGDPGSARPYDSSGNFKPFSSGEYYFSDVSPGSTSVCLYVYEHGFDPTQPERNLVARLTGADSVFLDRDSNYEFVVQTYWSEGWGGNQYFYLMTREAPFRINPAMSGNWFDPAKPGQGFFIDFLADTDEAFVGWFTYELADVDTAGTRFGSGRHRWLTAFGRVAETDPGTLDLEIELTRGGRFVQANPSVSQELAGTMTVSFADCNSGLVHFEIEHPALTGDVPIGRVSNARSGQCRDAYRGPGPAGAISSRED